MSGGTLINGWKGALAKDWTFSGNINVHSGNPFTATVGGNRSQVSGTAVSNTVRADSTGQPVEVPACSSTRRSSRSRWPETGATRCPNGLDYRGPAARAGSLRRGCNGAIERWAAAGISQG